MTPPSPAAPEASSRSPAGTRTRFAASTSWQPRLAGDAAAEAILGEFAWWIGLGLGNLANVLDPDLIVLGGGLVNAGELLLEPVRASFAEFVESREDRDELRIVLAALGDRGGAIGAGAIGLAAADGALQP